MRRILGVSSRHASFFSLFGVERRDELARRPTFFGVRSTRRNPRTAGRPRSLQVLAGPAERPATAGCRPSGDHRTGAGDVSRARAPPVSPGVSDGLASPLDGGARVRLVLDGAVRGARAPAGARLVECVPPSSSCRAPGARSSAVSRTFGSISSTRPWASLRISDSGRRQPFPRYLLSAARSVVLPKSAPLASRDARTLRRAEAQFDAAARGGTRRCRRLRRSPLSRRLRPGSFSTRDVLLWRERVVDE